jgi:hypothetical protein
MSQQPEPTPLWMYRKPDPTRQLVTEPQNIQMLEQEFQQMLRQKRNRFSPQAISTLNYAGIVGDDEKPEDVVLTPATTSAIRSFLTMQKRFIPRRS